jgi:predicted nucleic acid-binding protein
MKVALDSSVLLTIFNGEEGSESWLELLINARRKGRLCLCEIVYAEISPAFETRDALDSVLDRLGASLEPLRSEAAWRAGMTFRQYRRQGGPREFMIPDFLIAAHACAQADSLAVIDRGYLRSYFPDLDVLCPRSVK